MEYSEGKSKKNLIIGIIIAIVIVIVALLIVLNNRTYKVTFNDGYETKEIVVKSNKILEKPANPTKKGYRFIGWYYNGVKFDFNTKIKKNITLEARFEKEDIEFDEPVIKEETTTAATTTVQENTTKPNSTKGTTKKNNNSVATTKPTQAPAPKPTTVQTTTSTRTTTASTTKAVEYGYYWVDDKNSSIGQSVLYIINKNTNAKVSGTATITYISGASETVSISSSGRMFVRSTVSSVSNIKGN